MLCFVYNFFVLILSEHKEEVLNALNNRMMVGGIFCDIYKAFDCVNDNILLAKLEF
jgi:hypothetical protein